MKKILLATTMLAGLTAAASAADLPRRVAPPVFTPVPVFTWTGFYAGFNAGYGFGVNDQAATTVVSVPANGILVTQAGGAPAAGFIGFNNDNRQDGFVGGGQIGYNIQLTPGSGVVFGIEADAQYVDFGRNRNRVGGFVGAAPIGNAPGVSIINPNGLSNLDFFGTVRGRLGYAFDRLLVFGTGGFAYGSGGNEVRAGVNTDVSDFRTGWAAGGGFEYALPTDSFLNFFRSSAVTFKVEALYVNLERNRTNGVFAVNAAGAPVGQIGVTPGVTAVGFANRREDEFAVIRAGLNYKFGSY